MNKITQTSGESLTYALIYLAVSCSLVGLPGCGEKQKTVPVEDLPHEKLALPSIKVPDATEGIDATKIVALSKDSSVRRESEFAVTGVFTPTSDIAGGGSLSVRIMDRRSQGSNLVVDHKNARLKKRDDGNYDYRAELKAPKQWGVYELHVRYGGKKIMKAKLVVR